MRRTAERGDQESGHNCGVETGLWRDARSDAEGHGQWQRDEANRDSRKQVVQKRLLAVITQGYDQLGEIGVAN